MREKLTQACEFLRAGRIVAIPTETVYGMAVDATNDSAIAGLYAAKQRPSFNPLILHVTDLKQAQQYGHFSGTAQLLAKRFWQAGTPQHRPLTLVVPLKEPSPISKLATAGLRTIGIRVPDHPMTQALLSAYNLPLTAPSANKSTHISATQPARIRAEFQDEIALILDGGDCRVGVESTILDMSVPDMPCTLLRPGGTPLEEIAEILGYTPTSVPLGTAIKAPGMMKRHYAPSIPLYCNCTHPKEGAAFLGFGAHQHGPYSLSRTGDLKEATANLFRMLAELDDPARFSAICVAPIPSHHLGLAINDRLIRASVPAK